MDLVVEPIRALRRRLWSIERRLTRGRPAPNGTPSARREREREISLFLRSLDLPDASRAYVEHNMRRIVRTLALVPEPRGTGRVLELGAYMQMTPALAQVIGYSDVRGAYFGPLGTTDTKVSTAGGREIFRCLVDLFDAERDAFPYEDGSFETVLACEIVEHLLLDPMHMLVEIHRVLEDGGAMVLTTPNAASYTAVIRVLRQEGNPQLYSKYPDPSGEWRDMEVPHVREYTPDELRECVESAGFEVEELFTEPLGTFDPTWVKELLGELGYPTDRRGELLFCVARKRAGHPITRYPTFLYDG